MASHPIGRQKCNGSPFQMLAEFDKDIARNVNLKWRYIMFADYQDLAIDKLYHRLDLNLTAKVGL